MPVHCLRKARRPVYCCGCVLRPSIIKQSPSISRNHDCMLVCDELRWIGLPSTQLSVYVHRHKDLPKHKAQSTKHNMADLALLWKSSPSKLCIRPRWRVTIDKTQREANRDCIRKHDTCASVDAIFETRYYEDYWNARHDTLAIIKH